MFETFSANYRETSRADSSTPNPLLLAAVESHALGFRELMARFAGASFNEGLYRIHPAQDVLEWTAIVEEAFPLCHGRTVCFASDWLGRQFALDKARVEDGQMQILLVVPGTGDRLQIPATLESLHEHELIEHAGDAVAGELYRVYREAGGEPPAPGQCVGYEVPLFAGGEDVVDNLGLIDMKAYWKKCGQAFQAANPPADEGAVEESEDVS